MIVYGVLPVLVFCSVPINQAANANGGRTRLDWPVSSVDAAQVTDVPAQRRQKWNGLTEFKREFTDKGWLKVNIEVKKIVAFTRASKYKKGKPAPTPDESREVAALSHEIDHVKRIGDNVLAMEIEWNNKDPFYDRDLESFARLHGEGAISVGIIVTRGLSLHNQLESFFQRFSEDRSINSLADLEPFGYEPTSRQKENIQKKISGNRGFREAWVEAFVSDKFGEATTHWRKLEDRVRRGVGSPCPLLLIGLPASVVTFDYSAARGTAARL